MEPKDYALPDTWLPMSMQPKFVHGQFVDGKPVVLLTIGIPIGLTLEFAEQILAELASVVHHTRILHRTKQEKS